MTREDEELLTAMKPRETGLWQGWGCNTTEAQARALFKAKFGVEPAIVKLTCGCTLAGPVPGTEPK